MSDGLGDITQEWVALDALTKAYVGGDSVSIYMGPGFLTAASSVVLDKDAWFKLVDLVEEAFARMGVVR